MAEKPLHTERRKYARCHFRADEFRVIIGSSEAIGGMKDISLDGLAFTYDPIRGQSLEEIPIDRLTIDCPGFRLTDIACNKKYDIRVLSEGRTFSGQMARRCGVRFVGLTVLNKFKIKHMLHMCQSRFMKNVAKAKRRQQRVLAPT